MDDFGSGDEADTPPETDGGDTPEEPDEPGPEPNEGPDIG